MKHIAFFCLIVMLTSFTYPVRSIKQIKEKEIEEFINEFNDAWNKHDLRAVAGMWMDEGSFMDATGQRSKGPAAIEKLLSKLQTGSLRKSSIKLEITNIYFLNPDTSLVDVNFTTLGILDPQGRDKPPLDFRMFYVLSKSKDIWSIAAARMYQTQPSLTP